MNVHIHHSRRIPGDHLEERVARSLHAAVDRFDQHVEEIRLWLDDVNGPKGGLGLSGKIVVQIRGLPDLILSEVDQSLDALLARLSDRLGNALARKLRRRRDSRRHGAMGFVPIAS